MKRLPARDGDAGCAGGAGALEATRRGPSQPGPRGRGGVPWHSGALLCCGVRQSCASRQEGTMPPRPPAMAPPRSTCEQHLPFAEGKSRWNKSNFSRPCQVGEIKSQVTAGLFPECEWTTLTSTSANSQRIYTIWKE